MARPACSSSLFSVVRVSSGLAARSLTHYPSKHFVLSETPILAEPIPRQGINRTLSRVSVNPRNRHLQKPGDLMHGQKLRVVFISVVHHCGLLLQNAARTKYSAP